MPILPQPLALALFLIFAFVFAGVAQVLWLSSDQSRRFSRPIDGGRRFRGRRIFGDNKTWRGIVVLVPATGCSFVALSLLRPMLPQGWAQGLWEMGELGYFAAGAWAGLGFMLGELPNSFVKRQLGIEPGLSAEGAVGRVICAVGDRIDSIIGMLLTLTLVLDVPPLTWLYVLLLGPGIHLGFSALLLATHVKSRLA